MRTFILSYLSCLGTDRQMMIIIIIVLKIPVRKTNVSTINILLKNVLTVQKYHMKQNTWTMFKLVPAYLKIRSIIF